VKIKFFARPCVLQSSLDGVSDGLKTGVSSVSLAASSTVVLGVVDSVAKTAFFEQKASKTSSEQMVRLHFEYFIDLM